MILAANQPYFMPYIGYFQLINSVEKFLLVDDFQYIRHGWVNRNRILTSGKVIYIIVPLLHSSQNKNINQLMCVPPDGSQLRSVEAAYRRAPFYHQITSLLRDVLDFPDRRLNYFLLNSLQVVCDYLGITTPLILNSERNDTTELRGEERVVHLCKSMGADTYINAIGGRELYSRERFAADGIDLRFIKSQLPPYKQLRTQEFVPALSILDVMMNVPKDEIRDMLNRYTLI